ncbi:hypothetical protein CHH28_09150 [Bacterioplanes sanyensis]|uniref:Uncharacterized protein n=1 Tax=Bacterioplanes sanyensis TaxID=1249553 RepID=A0A222FJS4_9GAMM|nr:hypothetical protein [Bacterioplanes sanyensis]ASP38836.1 hypothetical protein CHH28_09150 [Bacterioplanes sanyensis]
MQQCHAYVTEPGIAQQLEQLLVALPQLQFSVNQQGLEQARSRYQQQASPRLLILDLSGYEYESDAVAALLALADVCAAGTRVLALGARQDVAFFKRLTALGVSDYVPLPATPAELRQHILPLLADAGSNTVDALHCRQMVVAGLSGGVGASTIVAQLSRLLSDHVGMHLGLVDANPLAGGLDLYVGQTANDAFARIWLDDMDVDELFIQRAGQSLGTRRTLFKTLAHGQWLNATQLTRVRQRLSPCFSALMWDLPSHQLWQAELQPWWQQANDVLLVAEASVRGVRDIQRSLELVAECQGQVRWLINAAHDRPTLLPEEVLQHTGLSPHQVSWLAHDRSVRQAQELGKPLKRGRFVRSLQPLQLVLTGHSARQRRRWLPVGVRS